ncbi:ERBB-3 BINDING PROTEIN 1 [Lathyrus oleraceus]|uniref:ERBB-3 BINDING PROTEIN 1 n=1 Tax=Pisum sativum TaxID=3888 RepID=UPI0021D00DBF|nr:ERBB-3 BINDING PROTEIN 1-like [Pisum sativum]
MELPSADMLELKDKMNELINIMQGFAIGQKALADKVEKLERVSAANSGVNLDGVSNQGQGSRDGGKRTTVGLVNNAGAAGQPGPSQNMKDNFVPPFYGFDDDQEEDREADQFSMRNEPFVPYDIPPQNKEIQLLAEKIKVLESYATPGVVNMSNMGLVEGIKHNNTICHFSPLVSDETVLEEGHILKIDLACHIDGFIAVVAHTHVLQEGSVTGRATDVIAAANTAAEVALRLVRPGRKNQDVTDAIQKVAAAYDCRIVEGVLGHQMKQFVIDANKVVLNVSNPDTRVDDAEFEENEVYAIDIVASTGEGKPKLLDEKQTTIYKRAVDKSYHLKMKASRFILSEISQKFPIMPFSARALEEKRARLGLVECMNHELLQPYPVLHEKQGDFVAHTKFTALCYQSSDFDTL